MSHLKNVEEAMVATATEAIKAGMSVDDFTGLAKAKMLEGIFAFTFVQRLT